MASDAITPEPKKRKSNWRRLGPETTPTLNKDTDSAGHAMDEPSSSTEGQVASDFSDSTFQRHATLLGEPRMSQPMYAQQRSDMLRQIGRNYGNTYVRRLVDHVHKAFSRHPM